MNGVSKQGIPGERDSVSIWRVYMPADVDREQYVKTCFLTGTVSLVNEYGEIKHRVKIGYMNLQAIVFPADLEKFGSEVICLTAPYSGKLYVVEVFAASDEFCDQEENQYRLYKTGKGYAEVKVDGDGNILLSVDSEEDADITISVTNKERKGKLNINVNGDLLVQNDGTTTITTSNNILLQHQDKDGKTSVNIKKDEVLINSKKILLNDSDEPALLGNKTVDFISELLDNLNKESAGPYPLRGAAVYASMKQKLDQLKSELTFVK